MCKFLCRDSERLDLNKYYVFHPTSCKADLLTPVSRYLYLYEGNCTPCAPSCGTCEVFTSYTGASVVNLYVGWEPEDISFGMENLKHSLADVPCLDGRDVLILKSLWERGGVEIQAFAHSRGVGSAVFDDSEWCSSPTLPQTPKN